MSDESRKKIFVVDDEESIAESLKEFFTRFGYDVETESNGRLAYEKILGGQFDLVILDLMLPEMNGLEICRAVRKVSPTPPIIILSSQTETETVVRGLKIGAIDYMTKPFNLRELLQRARNVIKIYGTLQIPAQFTYLTTQDLVLCVESHEVTVGDVKVTLTQNEFNLLKYLLQNRRRVIDRDELIRNVWGYDFAHDHSVVDVSIHNLRRRLCRGSTERYIQTVRGVGYTIQN